MTLVITTTISVNDDEAYTAREAAILAAIAAHPAGKGITAAQAVAQAQGTVEHASIPTIKAAAPKAAAPRKPDADAGDVLLAKAAADLAAKQAAEAAPAATEEATLEAMEADLVGDAPTLQDAVTLATDMVGAGKATQVKAALAAAGGAKRVSELKGDAIAAFITAAQG